MSAPEATLGAIEFDESWGSPSPGQQREWDTAREDMLDDHVLGERGQGAKGKLRLQLMLYGGDTVVRLSEEGAGVLATYSLGYDLLAPHLDKYVQVCKSLGTRNDSYYGPGLEALDMAKKLAHDDASAMLQEHCPGLLGSERSYRRLWSLLFVLHVDTTDLITWHPGTR